MWEEVKRSLKKDIVELVPGSDLESFRSELTIEYARCKEADAILDEEELFRKSEFFLELGNDEGEEMVPTVAAFRASHGYLRITLHRGKQGSTILLGPEAQKSVRALLNLIAHEALGETVG